MPATHCFSYPADAPLDTAGRGSARGSLPGLRATPMTCYSYPITCVRYPEDAPPGTGNRDAVQPSISYLRRMPAATCFRY